MTARRHGFTLVELCLGMLITAMVAMSLAGFSLAVTHHWRQDQQSQQLQVAGARSGAMMASIVESARALACVSDDPASLFLWQKDAPNESRCSRRRRHRRDIGLVSRQGRT